MIGSCNCAHCPAFRRECEGCTEPCRYRECDGQCAACAVRCHRRDGLDAWLAGLGGLGLDVDLQPQPPFRLARYFPQLVNGLEVSSILQQTPDVAIGIAKVLTPGGDVSRRALPHEFGPHDLRAQWSLDARTRLTCIGNCKDDRLEALWKTQRYADRQASNVWTQLRVLGFDLATSLNFSIYLDDPRLEHLSSIKRTWLTVQQMQATGSLIPIPHLQWATALDLQRQLHYAQEQGFHTLTLNLQMMRRRDDWRTVEAGLPLIREQSPDLRLLFTGPAGLKRLAYLARTFPSASFTNANAHYLAAHGVQLERDGTRLIKTPVAGHPDLILAANARLYGEFLDELDGHEPPPPRRVPGEEDDFLAAFDEVTTALRTRFEVPGDRVAAAFDRLATDETILAAFRAWLETGQVDLDFRGSFPTWPQASCVPHPSLKELMDRRMSPFEAFLHLAGLACRVNEQIEIAAGNAGY